MSVLLIIEFLQVVQLEDLKLPSMRAGNWQPAWRNWRRRRWQPAWRRRPPLLPLVDAIYMVCENACGYEERCTTTDNVIGFTEYYCTRCASTLRVVVRREART